MSLTVETVQAQNYVSDKSGSIDKYIQESCKKVSSGKTTIQIQLLNKNVISVVCLNSAVEKVLVSAQRGGSVELNLTKGSC